MTSVIPLISNEIVGEDFVPDEDRWALSDRNLSEFKLIMILSFFFSKLP